MQFVNATTGFVVAYGGKILKTTNSGATWDTTSNVTTKELTTIFMLNETTGWIGGNLVLLGTSGSGGIAKLENFNSKIFYDMENDALQLQHAQSGQTLQIHDVTGRLLRAQNIDNAEFSLSLNGMKSGIYIVSLLGNRETQSFKFVKP